MLDLERSPPPLPSPALLPPAPMPYHVAIMSETGKCHIYDVRPLIDQLESPGSQGIQQRKDRAKRPVYTVNEHGRNEGFALDWAGSYHGSSMATPSDLRLIGDVTARFLTTAIDSGFTTAPSLYTSHTSSVEDLQWSPSEPTVSASCSADRSIKIWDVRVKSGKSVTGIAGAHDEDVNVISSSGTRTSSN